MRHGPIPRYQSHSVTDGVRVFHSPQKKKKIINIYRKQKRRLTVERQIRSKQIAHSPNMPKTRRHIVEEHKNQRRHMF